MTTKTLGDARRRQSLRSIELRWFFRVLELTLAKTNPSEDPFDVLDMLRDYGLKITAAEDGRIGDTCPIEYGDISVALAKAKRDYKKLEDDKWEATNGFIPDASKREAAIWNYEVPVCAGDPSNEYRVPIGDLWVKETDYAETCRHLGLPTYHWPKVSWPQETRDLAERESLDAPKPERLSLEVAEPAEYVQDFRGGVTTQYADTTNWASYENALKLILTGSTTRPLDSHRRHIFIAMLAKGLRDEHGRNLPKRKIPGVPTMERDGETLYFIPLLAKAIMEEFNMDLFHPPLALDYLNSLASDEGKPYFIFSAAPGYMAWMNSEEGRTSWELFCREWELKREIVEVQRMPVNTPSEKESQVRLLERFGNELKEVRKRMQEFEKSVQEWPAESDAISLLEGDHRRADPEKELRAVEEPGLPERARSTEHEKSEASELYPEESETPSAPTPAKQRKRTRVERLTAAMMIARDDLQAKRKRTPTAREVFDWLKENDETGTVDDHTDDALLWVTSEGKLKTTKWSAFENLYSRWRNRQTPT